MPIISILIVILVIGLVLYLIELLPIDGTMKLIARAIVILVLILWLLSLIGLLPMGSVQLR